MPPTGIADAVSCALRTVASGRPTACSSVRYTVAVDTTIPIAMPLSSRPTSRLVRLFDTRNTTALTIATPNAGSSRRRRPYQSDR
jgi:hypothetical protein